jgi:cell division transport system ATP-binding protein
VIFQEFELLFDRTVHQNLEFVLLATGWKDPNAIKSRIESSLESVGLENKGQNMPHQLSGGERQRVAIARALLNTPYLIIADEPTGNLDPQLSAEITQLLYNISLSGTAVLMASHDYIAMQQFHGKVWVCKEGAIQLAETK